MDKSLHETCGGRHPYNDIMDRLFTLYITADKKGPVGDGVDAPYKPLLASFPYLEKPDFSDLAIEKVKQLKAAAAAEKVGKRMEKAGFGRSLRCAAKKVGYGKAKRARRRIRRRG